jgi:hypothetical protein
MLPEIWHTFKMPFLSLLPLSAPLFILWGCLNLLLISLTRRVKREFLDLCRPRHGLINLGLNYLPIGLSLVARLHDALVGNIDTFGMNTKALVCSDSKAMPPHGCAN